MDPIHIHRLVLHPGSPKTGTSGIQNALFRARETLLEQGFLYPLAGIPMEGGVARGHHDIARKINPKQPHLDAEFLAVLEQLRAEVDARPDHTVILSSEEFFGVERLLYMSRLVEVQHLTVYVCLRPQHEVLNANYYTQVTHKRITERPDTYFDCAIKNVRYLEVLRTLKSYSPRTDLHLRLFDKGSPARSGPLRDFASTLNLNLPRDAASDAVEHPTLPARATLFLRWLNEIGFDRQTFFDVFQSLHRMRNRLPDQMYTMSPLRVETMSQHFDAENREIRRLFFDGQDAPLFQLPIIPDQNQWEADVGQDHVKVERDFLLFLSDLAAKTR